MDGKDSRLERPRKGRCGTRSRGHCDARSKVYGPRESPNNRRGFPTRCRGTARSSSTIFRPKIATGNGRDRHELSDAAWHGVEFNSKGGCFARSVEPVSSPQGGSQPPTLLQTPSALGITIGWEPWGTLPDQCGGDLTGQADIGGIRFPPSRRGKAIAVGFQPTGSPCTGIGNTAGVHLPKAAGNTPGERHTTRHQETERFPCRQESLCLPRTRRAFCGEGRAAVVPRSREEWLPGQLAESGSLAESSTEAGRDQRSSRRYWMNLRKSNSGG